MKFVFVLLLLISTGCNAISDMSRPDTTREACSGISDADYKEMIDFFTIFHEDTPQVTEWGMQELAIFACEADAGELGVGLDECQTCVVIMIDEIWRSESPAGSGD